MSWRDVRCLHPAGSYKPGDCYNVLVEVSSTGGIRTYCRKCHHKTTIHRSELDQYRTDLVFST